MLLYLFVDITNNCHFLEGMKVVQKIGSVPTGAKDKPLADVKVFKVYPQDSALLTDQ